MDDGDAVGARGIDARDGDLLSVDEDLAFFGDVDAAKHLNQRRFARAVFAQQGVDLAGFELEVHVLQGLDAGDRLADVFHFEQIFAHRVSPPFLLHERAPRAGDAPGGTNFIVRQEQADQAFCRTAKFLRCQGNDCLILKRALP